LFVNNECFSCRNFRFPLHVSIFLPCRRIENKNNFVPLRRLLVILCLLFSLPKSNVNLAGRHFFYQIKGASLLFVINCTFSILFCKVKQKKTVIQIIYVKNDNAFKLFLSLFHTRYFPAYIPCCRTIKCVIPENRAGHHYAGDIIF